MTVTSTHQDLAWSSIERTVHRFCYESIVDTRGWMGMWTGTKDAHERFMSATERWYFLDPDAHTATMFLREPAAALADQLAELWIGASDTPWGNLDVEEHAGVAGNLREIIIYVQEHATVPFPAAQRTASLDGLLFGPRGVVHLPQ